jgi:hypothetical protein
MSRLTIQRKIRPDIIVAVTWDNWYSQWIKRILRLENFVKFIAHVFIRVVNMRRRTWILIIVIMTKYINSIKQDKPDIISCPDDKVDFIFPDFVDVFECRVDERKGRVAWSVGNGEMARCTIIIRVEI